jgi:dihydromonapterin reductase/dihydrofolate reductase
MSQQRFLVTGCSRRLGLFLAHRLLARGAKVFAHYRTHRPALDTLADAGAQLVQADFDDADARQQLIQRIREESDYLSGIIHNASAFAPSKALEEGASAQFEAFFRVHMLAPFEINEALLDKLYANPEPHSHLIHITDIYAQRPQPSHHSYCATKAGLASLNDSWALRLAPKVRVNQIAPGPILFLDDHDQAHRDEVLAQTPLGVEGGLEPIGKAVDYLLDNPYITGSRMTVDGGRSLAR